jgi:hypothetical protein
LGGAAQFAVTTVVGGTVSVIGGGKFANGAAQAGFGYLFNHLGSSPEDSLTPASRPGVGAALGDRLSVTLQAEAAVVKGATISVSVDKQSGIDQTVEVFSGLIVRGVGASATLTTDFAVMKPGIEGYQGPQLQAGVTAGWKLIADSFEFTLNQADPNLWYAIGLKSRLGAGAGHSASVSQGIVSREQLPRK